MITLIIGGAKSGKSMYAQNLSRELKNNSGNMIYVATMNPSGEEDLNKINNHIKDRIGYGFITIEIQRNLNNILSRINKNDTLLIDSLTSIVTNEMFIGKDFNNKVQDKIVDELINITKNSLNVIMVSDYVFSDSISYDC
ncbi:MAG: bifunctional adenosylcobinamide kinase/adenosylcobinamide-phosphate guanylyltransferase, partial [Clostridium sp.]